MDMHSVTVINSPCLFDNCRMNSQVSRDSSGTQAQFEPPWQPLSLYHLEALSFALGSLKLGHELENEHLVS